MLLPAQAQSLVKSVLEECSTRRHDRVHGGGTAAGDVVAVTKEPLGKVVAEFAS
jgi:hypothetical protein